MNMAVAEGEVIAGKYRVERVLGRGGVGVVVAAGHLSMPQRVAIKLLLNENNPERAERFLREARAAASLRGEHVVRVLDIGQTDALVPYVVMEYLEGEDFTEVLRRYGRLTVPEALEYVLQACVALAEAHAAGIVHRDLKPANLFLATAADGTRIVKVLDFGISKELPSGAEHGGASLTRTRGMLGAPLFMAPEQMTSSRPIDARADIWALGALLYRFVTGVPPFDADTLADLVHRITNAAPRPPRELCMGLAPELERTLLRCLEKDPSLRPANVAELALALAAFAPQRGEECAERAARILGVRLELLAHRSTLPTYGLGLSSPPSVPPPSRTAVVAEKPAQTAAGPTLSPPGNKPRRRAALVLVAVLAVLAILGVVALVLQGSGEPPPPPPASRE
jgi:eukaryotic-like serine/threonine-protein kinase